MMSFKKYVISMVVCAVTIFVMIFNAFVPVVSYASSITIEQEFSTYYYAKGIQQGIPYLYSYFQNLVGYNSSVKDKYNEFCTYNYSKILYITTVNKSLGTKTFQVVKYNSLNTSKSSYHTLIFTGCEAVSLTISTSIQDGVEIVGASIKKDFTDRDYYSFSNIKLDLNDYYLQFSNSVSSEFDNTTENDLGLQTNKFLAFGDWLLNTIGNTGALAYTGDYGSFFDNLQDINRTYLKNFLGTTDDSLIDDVYKAFLNGNWGDVLLGNNEPLQAEQIADISNILKNLQNVYDQSVSISYNEGDSKYYITPSTAYNNYTTKQITDYYNRYIAYNTTNNYSNVTYNVDLTTTNSFISSVNANIIALNNNIIVLSNTINDFFINFDIRIKNILVDLGLNNIVTILDLINSNVKNISTGSNSDVDLTSVTDILTNIKTDVNSLVVAFADFDFNAIVGGFADIDANFNALGGVIAGAINTAWADIKGELKLLIEGINFRFGDISIGDSTSSDDDTSTTNKIKINFDSLVDKLNIKLKGLFDDLKVSLDDLFSDIHITIDKDNTKDNPDTPTEPVEDDFWKDLCNIIKNKIPLFAQCVELLEPITNTCIDDINTNHLISDSHGSFLLTQQYSVCSYYSIDGQLEFDTPIVTNFFDGLISIKQSADNSVVALGVSLKNVQYYGYTFSGFWLDISYYYNNYRVKLSNLLLFFCYIGFAFSVIHRTSKLFGYSSSSNDD